MQFWYRKSGIEMVEEFNCGAYRSSLTHTLQEAQIEDSFEEKMAQCKELTHIIKYRLH
jgi:hypothetical protein